jgi:parallel beta-helix repeat protein
MITRTRVAPSRLRFLWIFLTGLSLLCSGAIARAASWDYDNVITLEAGPNLPFDLKALFLTVKPGTVIQLPEGTYHFDDELILNTSHVTIKGMGMDKTILSFAQQPRGAQGILVQADAFAIMDLAIEDTAGDGLKMENSNGVVVQRVRVEWTNGPAEDNGAYGFYPINCDNVLIEDSAAIGASDAGIYVGQSRDIVVRRNRAEYNVAGIEIENSTNADVYENLATNNTGGILVFDMPNLTQAGHHTRVYNNQVINNNTKNFAPAGNIVGKVPTGTGVMILSTDWVHVFDNVITGNKTTNFAIFSFVSVAMLDGTPLPDGYDPYPEHIYAYNNVMQKQKTWFFDGGEFNLLANLLFMLKLAPVADIVVDGQVASDLNGADWCFQDNVRPNGTRASFGNFQLNQTHWLLKLLGIPGTPAKLGYPVESNCTQADFGPVELDLSVFDTVPEPEEEYTEEEVAALCAGGDASTVNWPAFVVNCPSLSSYRLFIGNDPLGNANTGSAAPYDLTTPLFSDYAHKYRHVFLPPGTSAQYSASGPFEFPVGTIISKTFTLPLNTGVEKVVETRLLIRRASGWTGVAYIWNEDLTEANLALGGGAVAATVLDPDGNEVTVDYRVPNANQCTNCHGVKAPGDDAFRNLPIGPKARFLNRSFAYAGGSANQLAHWSAIGILTDAPLPQDAPRLPVWNDPLDGTEEMRAKAYLEINCAHCHSATGRARATGLWLMADQPLDATYGLCKPPVAAGSGSGGLKWDIVPGNAAQSILVFRQNSNDPAIRMPELGRSVVHTQGVDLVTNWINSLPGTCAEAGSSSQ